MNQTKKVLQKYPVNACGMRDDLSGGMLVLSRRNLVYLFTIGDLAFHIKLQTVGALFLCIKTFCLVI